MQESKLVAYRVHATHAQAAKIVGAYENVIT